MEDLGGTPSRHRKQWMTWLGWANLYLIVVRLIAIALIICGWDFRASRPMVNRTPTCQGNLKQLALVAAIYEQNHNQVLPLQSDWAQSMRPYWQSPLPLLCPRYRGLPVGYAIIPEVIGKSLKQVADQENTVLFFDTVNGRVSFRHHGGCWVAFGDGHAKWLSRDDGEMLGIGR